MSRTLYVYDKKAGRLVEANKVPKRRNVSGTWPVHAESIACNSLEAVREDQKKLREHGVRTEYDEEFRPILRSRAHAKAHKRALGYADPNAGYGDAEPLHAHSDIAKNDMGNPANRKRRLEAARQELIAKEYRLFGQRVSSI